MIRRHPDDAMLTQREVLCDLLALQRWESEGGAPAGPPFHPLGAQDDGVAYERWEDEGGAPPDDEVPAGSGRLAAVGPGLT